MWNPSSPSRAFALAALALFLPFLADEGTGTPPASTPPPQTADRLAQQQQWAEAREAYDAALQDLLTRFPKEARRLALGGITSALQLEDYDDALERIHKLRESDRIASEDKWNWPFMNGRNQGSEETRRAIEHGEQVRGLLIELSRQLEKNPQLASAERRQRVEVERIAADFQLVRSLLGPSFANEDEGFEPVPTERWWGRFDKTGRDGAETGDGERERGIPTGPDGRPRFVGVPAVYAPDLVPGAKTLFLLNEIEQLDTSSMRDDAARALLKRALIAWALYGPGTDPGWREAADYYGETKRPSFLKSYRGGPLKPFWELGDDEARTLVDGRVRVVALPASESPLALLRLVDQHYSLSSVAPEALFQRALYYQSRQQFAKALADYQELLKDYPRDHRVTEAEKHIRQIRQPDVLLGSTAVFPAGSRPKLWFAHRQTTKVEFTARPVEVARWLRDLGWRSPDRKLKEDAFDLFPSPFWGDDQEKQKRLRKFLGKDDIRWRENLPKADHLTNAATLAPLTRPGVYLVEARTAGRRQGSRVLVVVSDVTLVEKDLPGRSLLFAADARTGQPVANLEVYAAEENDTKVRTLKTDRWGVLEHVFAPDAPVLALSPAGGLALLHLRSRYREDEQKQSQICILTDRPVYRPGTTVGLRAWRRVLVGRQYDPPQAGQPLRAEIRTPAGYPLKTLDLQTDRFGGVTGAVNLDAQAPLGEYSVFVHERGSEWRGGRATFRVEAYKKPEFAVTVQPTGKPARLGDKVQVRVAARYYFGQPVAAGEVRYQVYRADAPTVPAVPREFDWLYGPGYGRYAYDYPWLPGGGRTRAVVDEPDETAGEDGEDQGERRTLLSQGQIVLNEQGTADITIDTALLAPGVRDTDQRLTVVAEVRDASRRTIRGEGQVVVTRQELAASVELDRGWYPPNSQATAEVTLRTVQGAPVAGTATLRLLRISYHGADKGKVRLEPVHSRQVETDARGRLTTRIDLPQEGQYRVEFETRDTVGPVVAAAVVWVHGPRFDGRLFRYADLEIIPDRRSYKVGDTAHLLIHTANPRAHVLFSDDAYRWTLRDYNFLDVPAHATVVDLRIEERHVPNFFVEATTVFDGRVHTEGCELYVPPVNELLTVRILTDKQLYKPGGKGTVRVKVTDASGKPTTGQVTLTAYDKALTYVQEEASAQLRDLIILRKREGAGEYGAAGLRSRFHASGRCLCAEFKSTHVRWFLAGGGGGAGPAGEDESVTNERGGRLVEREEGGVVPRVDVLDATAGGGAVGRRAARPRPSPRPVAPPVIRSNFADSALWQPALEIGKDGMVEAKLSFPESLTTWRLRAYALSNTTQVGDATDEVLTSKDLLVRLQAPRFLVEGDEVVLSANVHNARPTERHVRAELRVPAAQFALREGVRLRSRTDEAGNLCLAAEADVPAAGLLRLDWPLRVLKPGPAALTVQALADDEGDAMRLTVPVLRGVPREVVRTGSYRQGDEGGRAVALTLPEKTDPQATRLEVTVGPGQVGAMLDALPFLSGYPYGCTEQTMSRFYPTVVAADTLRRLGTNLEAIRRRRPAPSDLAARFRAPGGAVFDSAEIDRMARAGLERLATFQHPDGGWGWWQHDQSSPYMTAYVLLGLHAAHQAGVAVQWRQYQHAYQFLFGSLKARDSEPPGRKLGADLQTQALVAYVLALQAPRNASGEALFEVPAPEAKQARGQLDALFAARASLTPYGRALLALAFHHHKDAGRASTVLREILSTAKRGDPTGSAWIPTSADPAWHWWHNDVETNAWVLRALVHIDPRNDLAPLLAKGLLDRRPGGTHWHSTRDTALAVLALADYLLLGKQSPLDCRIVVRLDGKPVKEVRFNRENFLTVDSRLLVEGQRLTPGRHEVSFTKTGRGEVYFTARLAYVAKEEVFKPEGHGLAIRRDYYRTTAGAGPARVPLKDGERLAAGDTIDVVLTVTADHDYEYLAFEDRKPAGFEPVLLQSGGLWMDGQWVTLELGDEKVAFFVESLRRGTQVFRYQLRAETAGVFEALPATGFAMYAPEVRASSGSRRLAIGD